MERKGRAYAAIVAGAALWGLIGLWNRRLMAGGISPTDIVAVRNIGGMALLGLHALLRRREVFTAGKRY